MRRRIIAAVLCAALFCAMAPGVSAQEDYETRIYEFLTETMKLNTAAACGILGNLHVETGGTFSPTSYNPNDSGGTKSYGICQWNNGAGSGNRYGKLYSWCRANGYDPESLEGQLRYMQYELESTPYFRLSDLRAVPNTKEGAKKAAQIWEVYYEGCSSAGYALRERYATDTYWPKYSVQTPVIVHESACGGDQNKCASAKFTDAPPYGNWAHGGIDYVVSHGYFNGTSSTTFSPNAPMTRAMLVTVLWRGCGSPDGFDNPFTDVKDGAYYAQAAAWGHTFGIVKGMEECKFGPDVNVTREQLATFLFRLTQLGESDSGKRAQLSAFPDAAQVSAYATDAMQWAVGAGLIEGVGDGGKDYLRPKNSATRAQVAAIIMRFSAMLEKQSEGVA